MSEEVTLGEVARRLDTLHTDLKELRAAVVERHDLEVVTAGWQAALTAHERTAEIKWAAAEARLASLENWQTWALRLVVGAVLTAMVGVVLVTRV